VPRAAKHELAVHAYTLRDDLVNLDRFNACSGYGVFYGMSSERSAVSHVEGTLPTFG
jgi:hypothetical protein